MPIVIPPNVPEQQGEAPQVVQYRCDDRSWEVNADHQIVRGANQQGGLAANLTVSLQNIRDITNTGEYRENDPLQSISDFLVDAFRQIDELQRRYDPAYNTIKNLYIQCTNQWPADADMPPPPRMLERR